MPVALYLAFEKGGRIDTALGCFGLVCVFIVLLTTNARGAILSSVIVALIYLVIYLYRRQRTNSVSLLPSLLSLLSMVAVPALALTKRVQYTILGGGATAASNEGRTEQFHLALPKIFGSPLYGHGIGTAADVVGYNPGSYVTLDSGMLSILVDLGLPGFALFIIMLLFPSFQMIKMIISNSENWSAGPGVALALSLLSFAINTFVLAQIENYGLLYLLLGLFVVWQASFVQDRTIDGDSGVKLAFSTAKAGV